MTEHVIMSSDFATEERDMWTRGNGVVERVGMTPRSSSTARYINILRACAGEGKGGARVAMMYTQGLGSGKGKGGASVVP